MNVLSGWFPVSQHVNTTVPALQLVATRVAPNLSEWEASALNREHSRGTAEETGLLFIYFPSILPRQHLAVKKGRVMIQ